MLVVVDVCCLQGEFIKMAKKAMKSAGQLASLRMLLLFDYVYSVA